MSYLILEVGGHVFARLSKLGDPTFAEVNAFAARVGLEVKGDGHRRSMQERDEWPLTARVYTSWHRNGVGRSGSSLWSYPARRMPCAACVGNGSRGKGADARACRRCRGTGTRGLLARRLAIR